MELKKANIYKRGIAFIIDEFIISTARALIMLIFYGIIVHYQFEDFKFDVLQKLSTLPDNATISQVGDALKGLRATPWIVSFVSLFVIVSGVYSVFMYKFKNGQTIGKKMMSIVVLKKNQGVMTTGDILTRVLWSYAPWFLPFISYELYSNGIFLYLPLTVLWFFWYDPWIILGKRGTTMHDFLSATSVFEVPVVD